MKKLTYFLFLLTAILIVSCKKEKIPPVKSNLFIIGQPEAGNITSHPFSPQ